MTSVSDLLKSAGLRLAGLARWGRPPGLAAPGVYLVATTPNPDESRGAITASIDPLAVRSLLAARPEATVGGTAATEASMTDRLKALWVPGEPVVYIGLAGTSVAHRVKQYYRTALGARAPHAGGWPIKLLADLDQLWVHYAAADELGEAEAALLQAFADGVDAATVAKLHDATVVLPFANLQRSPGVVKAHGFSGVKAPRPAARRRRR